jgi:simple sugar transport system substrate-binding protein
MTPAVDKAISDGRAAFAIDQQPYLQGYIPVALLALMKRDNTHDVERALKELIADPAFQNRLKKYGLVPHFGPYGVATGPSFVTRTNLGVVEKYTGQYR